MSAIDLAAYQCRNGHLYDDANTGTWPDGTRKCLACTNEKARRYRERHRSRLNAQMRERRQNRRTPCP